MRIKVKGHPWTVKVLSKKYYDRVHGSDSAAITHLDTHQIFISNDKLSIGVALHELLHAYVSSCCLESATDLSAFAMEEICAGILESHGEEMMDLAHKIVNKFSSKKSHK